MPDALHLDKNASSETLARKFAELYFLNLLKTSPEYTRAGVYGICVLEPNQIIFNYRLMQLGSHLHTVETLYRVAQKECNTYDH